MELLLDGLARLITDGLAAAASTLQRAVGIFASADIPAVTDSGGAGWPWRPPMRYGTTMAGARSSRSHLKIIRAAGALDQLPIYLAALGTASVWSGDFAEAASLIAEAHAVSEATGTRIAPFAAMLLDALPVTRPRPLR